MDREHRCSTTTFGMQTPRSFHHLALIGILGVAILPFTPEATALEAIRISSDKRSFILAESGKPFRVWGVNYDHDSKGENGRLLEDYWHDEWETVRSDFEEMKALGANVVRVHLQFGKFMRAADTPNQDALDQLRRVIELAERTGLYLDLTGLGCYHKADTPKWYDEMAEAARWNAQARFWSAVAKTCRDSRAANRG